MTDPLFILAMDHRDSFGRTLFGVRDDRPTPAQVEAMRAAKRLIFEGLRQAEPPSGRRGVLVDEEYGTDVIDAAKGGPIVLAVPIEASGQPWFTPQYGAGWLEHIEAIRPDYAKVLIRDNPDFDPQDRARQLTDLAAVAEGLRGAGVPLLYELLVPATPPQLAGVGGDTYRYDRDVRPALVDRVIADNQEHGIVPSLWKVEGLETVEAAREIAARASSRGSDLLVLGRDAPKERLDHWLEVACQVPEFAGFAIGRSIWEDVLRSPTTPQADQARIAQNYLSFTAHWKPPA